jgi:glucose/arabinose dehydrogenase/PKD repeat protein
LPLLTRRTNSLLATGLVIAASLLLAASAWAEIEVLPGFQARRLPLPVATAPTYSNGLQHPSTLDFAPDGKLFVAERNGRVLEFDSLDDQTPTLVLSILDEVMAYGDRGLLGMKLDPEYPAKPYIYLSYTYDAPIGGDSAASTHPHLSDGSDYCEEAVNDAVDCLVSGRLARVELDPTTSVAVGGPEDPASEQVLINSWCQQTPSHSIGDIEFDSDGALLMGGGDGANWVWRDYGQQGNPCNDPPDEGGSLRSQDLRTPATPSDPTDYNGSIIRINRETGAAMPDNPLSLEPLFGGGVEDVAARRIIAEGMRNPYRFTIQPGSGDLYIGDVGQDLWEEVNRLEWPPSGLANYGWPCFEGGPNGNEVMPIWQAAEGETGKPLCQPLYSDPAQVTAPLFAYLHPHTPGTDGHAFPGDGCNPQPGSAIAGLTFYDPAGVPSENVLPAEFDGALFITDAARKCVWSMLQGPDGRPDPSTMANFARAHHDETFNPVDVVQGPDGALYMPDFYVGSIMQIRYFPGNQPPTAALEADKTYGPAPLFVQFDASASTDPDLGDGDTLHYAWDLDGDGQFDDGTTPTRSWEYNQAVNVNVRVLISDDYNHSDVAEVKLYPGDLGPPQVALVAPAADLEWAIGDPIPYEATAGDPDGETFADALHPHWEFTLEHCPAGCHEHPITSADSPSGSFVAPPHGYPSHLKFEFTATDSRGMSDSVAVEVYPRTVQVGVASEPAGIPLAIDGAGSSTPFSTTVIAGGTSTVSAPATAAIDGVSYVFSEWSDGGAAVHEVATDEEVDLVARYELASPEPEGEGGDGGQIPPATLPDSLKPTPAPQPLSKTAHLRLASRPPGVPLRVGAVKATAPFALDIALDSESFLWAPQAIRRNGEPLRFKRWIRDGHAAGRAARRELAVRGDARWVALYGPAQQRPHGGR